MNPQDKQQRLFKPSARMAEPDIALASYLDSLLSEIAEPEVAEELPTTKVDSPTAAIQQQQLRLSEPIVPHDSRQAAKAEADLETTARQAVPIVPEWAKTPFQVLLCKVSGLTLGVPLTALVSIIKGTERVAELPGQPAWHLGVLVYREHKILVVDTAYLVMPEKLDQQNRAKRYTGAYLLLIEDGQWGLTVDALASTVRLDQHQVRWRISRGNRPWQAGTMIEQLAVLLDVDGLAEMLHPAARVKPSLAGLNQDRVKPDVYNIKR